MRAPLRVELLRVEAALASEVNPAVRSDLQLRRANLRARIRRLDDAAEAKSQAFPLRADAETGAAEALRQSAARRRERRRRLRRALDDLEDR